MSIFTRSARVTPLTRQQAVAGSNGLMQYLNTLDHRYLEDTILDDRGRPVDSPDIANNLGDTVIFAINTINARPGIHAGVTANAVAEILREGILTVLQTETTLTLTMRRMVKEKVNQKNTQDIEQDVTD